MCWGLNHAEYPLAQCVTAPLTSVEVVLLNSLNAVQMKLNVTCGWQNVKGNGHHPLKSKSKWALDGGFGTDPNSL